MTCKVCHYRGEEIVEPKQRDDAAKEKVYDCIRFPPVAYPVVLPHPMQPSQLTIQHIPTRVIVRESGLCGEYVPL